jgi:3-hydroxyacyl-CoA dehydrogenase/enoyl-CoA hydratase/3-hydroxybutyryl-CoA epimerase
MIRSLFVSMQELEQGRAPPRPISPRPILKKVGVIGAGLMGAGIRLRARRRPGLRVVLIDRDQEAPTRARRYSAKLIGEQVKRGRAKQADATRCSRASRRRRLQRAQGCDLVIEAVFEDRKVKAEATAKAQAVVGDKVVFGSNTSTLPITSLAESSKDRRTSSACISSRRSTR